MTQTLGIIGAGSIGGTVAQAFGELGYDVFINDTDPERAAALDLPAREKSWLGAHCDVVMVAVPTPTGEDGGDASIVEQAVRPLRDADATVCIRSTMPPGETGRIAETLEMPLVYAPEFMRDRAGVADFFERDRLVFAGPDPHRSRVRELFDDPQIRVTAVFECEDYLTAEIAKEAHNAFFATKVSFANQMRLLAERVGAAPETIMNIIIADSRNTDSHLDPMLGPYGGKCLVEGSRVATPDGYKNIEHIAVGDIVLDDVGMTEVTGKQTRTVPEIHNINARGRKISGSKDHIHIIYDESAQDMREKRLSDVKKGDWAVIPKLINDTTNQIVLGEPPSGYVDWWPTYFEIDDEMGWAIGLYLAEGCSSESDSHSILWSLGGHETDLADRLCSVLESQGLNPYKRKQVSDGTYGESECWIVRVRSQGLYKLFNILGLGDNAHNKCCPPFTDSVAKRIIGGWLDGDGYKSEGTISGYSRSRSLIRSMDRMLLGQGVCATIDDDGRRLRVSTRGEVEEVVDWTETYDYNDDEYVEDREYKSPTMRAVENGWAVKVRSVDKIDEAHDVVAIETESGKYCANNILTHNCLPKDTQALTHFASEHDVPTPLLEGTINTNAEARDRFENLDIEGRWPHIEVQSD